MLARTTGRKTRPGLATVQYTKIQWTLTLRNEAPNKVQKRPVWTGGRKRWTCEVLSKPNSTDYRCSGGACQNNRTRNLIFRWAQAGNAPGCASNGNASVESQEGICVGRIEPFTVIRRPAWKGK